MIKGLMLVFWRVSYVRESFKLSGGILVISRYGLFVNKARVGIITPSRWACSKEIFSSDKNKEALGRIRESVRLVYDLFKTNLEVRKQGPWHFVRWLALSFDVMLPDDEKLFYKGRTPKSLKEQQGLDKLLRCDTLCEKDWLDFYNAVPSFAREWVLDLRYALTSHKESRLIPGLNLRAVVDDNSSAWFYCTALTAWGQECSVAINGYLTTRFMPEFLVCDPVELAFGGIFGLKPSTGSKDWASMLLFSVIFSLKKELCHNLVCGIYGQFDWPNAGYRKLYRDYLPGYYFDPLSSSSNLVFFPLAVQKDRPIPPFLLISLLLGHPNLLFAVHDFLPFFSHLSSSSRCPVEGYEAPFVWPNHLCKVIGDEGEFNNHTYLATLPVYYLFLLPHVGPCSQQSRLNVALGWNLSLHWDVDFKAGKVLFSDKVEAAPFRVLVRSFQQQGCEELLHVFLWNMFANEGLLVKLASAILFEPKRLMSWVVQYRWSWNVEPFLTNQVKELAAQLLPDFVVPGEKAVAGDKRYEVLLEFFIIVMGDRLIHAASVKDFFYRSVRDEVALLVRVYDALGLGGSEEVAEICTLQALQLRSRKLKTSEKRLSSQGRSDLVRARFGSLLSVVGAEFQWHLVSAFVAWKSANPEKSGVLDLALRGGQNAGLLVFLDTLPSKKSKDREEVTAFEAVFREAIVSFLRTVKPDFWLVSNECISNSRVSSVRKKKVQLLRKQLEVYRQIIFDNITAEDAKSSSMTFALSEAYLNWGVWKQVPSKLPKV